MAVTPGVLTVEEVSPGRWSVPHPDKDPEGRDIVFSGQILGQMIMASSAAAKGEKEVKSVHAVFARAGRYSAGPLELHLEEMHAGRAWASHTVTAVQGDRLLARGLVLLNTVEPDLMRHSPTMPDVPAPEQCSPLETGVVFPDSEVRVVEGVAGAPSMSVWVRSGTSSDSVAASQAIVAWCEPGLLIGAAIRPHRDTVDASQAHRTISTGVISHTAHFHEHGDPSDWLLYVHDATYAGHGRIFGQGSVFTREGTLVSTFGQDSMARVVEGDLDFKTGM
ncbi:MAG: acyl-CoA thioesterase [Acidimicrobiia bacterium]